MSGRWPFDSWARTASIAAAATSARITMPGPPPAGVSSTVRCLPRPWSRMSRTSSDQSFFSSALPRSEMPKGPGNISGNRVRTVTGQLLNVIIPLIVFGDRHNNIAGRDVELRHGFPAEGEQHAVAVGPLEFDHVA